MCLVWAGDKSDKSLVLPSSMLLCGNVRHPSGSGVLMRVPLRDLAWAIMGCRHVVGK